MKAGSRFNWNALLRRLSLIAGALLAVCSWAFEWKSFIYFISLALVVIGAFREYIAFNENKDRDAQIAEVKSAAAEAKLAAKRANLGRRLSEDTKAAISGDVGNLDLSSLEKLRIEIRYAAGATEAYDLSKELVELIKSLGLRASGPAHFLSPSQPAPYIEGIAIKSPKFATALADVFQKHLSDAKTEFVQGTMMTVVVGHRR